METAHSNSCSCITVYCIYMNQRWSIFVNRSKLLLLHVWRNQFSRHVIWSLYLRLYSALGSRVFRVELGPNWQHGQCQSKDHPCSLVIYWHIYVLTAQEYFLCHLEVMSSLQCNAHATISLFLGIAFEEKSLTDMLSWSEMKLFLTFLRGHWDCLLGRLWLATF